MLNVWWTFNDVDTSNNIFVFTLSMVVSYYNNIHSKDKKIREKIRKSKW